MGRRVVAVFQPSHTPADQQMRAIQAYCTEHGHRVVAVVRYDTAAAVALVQAGAADLIVAPFASARSAAAIDRPVAELGGRVEYARPRAPRRRLDPDLVALRMLARSIDVDLIAEVLELPADRVREIASVTASRGVS